MANIRKYLSTVEKIENPLEGIYIVSFSSKKKFKYKPGQFLHLAIDEYDGVGQWPESRCFSLQSNPEDEQATITFSTKGKFTNKMAEDLKPGKEIWLKMPYGDIFQRGHDKKNCVFIAGGTGLTPFLSLFTHNNFSEYEKPSLYLGIRTKEYNIFKTDLNLAKNINSAFNIHLKYENDSGILDIKDIYNRNGNKTYFISGPPIMIKNFKNYLLEKNLGEEKIITDDWE